MVRRYKPWVGGSAPPADLLTSDEGEKLLSPYKEVRWQTQELGRFAAIDGRTFRYGKVGDTALTRAELQQGPVAIDGHAEEVTGYASLINASVIDVNLTTVVVADALKDGFLVYNNVDGLGMSRRIIANGASDASDSNKTSITLSAPLEEAVLGTAEVTIMSALYGGAVICPTTITAQVIGVPLIDMSKAYFGWFLVNGLGPCVVEGTAKVGNPCTPSGSASGAVAPNGGDILPELGIFQYVNATTEHGTVNWNIFDGIG